MPAIPSTELDKATHLANRWLNDPEAGPERHYMAQMTLRLIARGHVLTVRLDESRRARNLLDPTHTPESADQ